MVAVFFAFIFGFPFDCIPDDYILADCTVMSAAENQIHIYDTNCPPRPPIRDDGAMNDGTGRRREARGGERDAKKLDAGSGK